MSDHDEAVRSLSKNVERLLRQVDLLKREKQDAEKVADTLRSQNQELEFLFQKAPVGLCLVDRELRYVRVNAWLADLNGQPISKHLGAQVADIVPTIASGTLAAYQRVFDTGEPLTNIEVRSEPPSDPSTKYTWRVNHHPVLDDAGTVVGVMSVVQDISDLYSLTQKLLHEQEIMNEAQHAVHVGNWEWDLVEDQHWWSDELHQIYGKDERLVPTFDTFFTLVHPDDRPRVRQQLDDAFENGISMATEFRIVRDDGVELTMLATIGLERRGTQPIRLFGTAQDITERRRNHS